MLVSQGRIPSLQLADYCSLMSTGSCMVTNSTMLVVGGWCEVECVPFVVLVFGVMNTAQ